MTDADTLLSGIDDILENIWGPNSAQPTEWILDGTTEDRRFSYEKLIGRALSDTEWNRVVDCAARNNGRIYIGAHDE